MVLSPGGQASQMVVLPAGFLGRACSSVSSGGAESFGSFTWRCSPAFCIFLAFLPGWSSSLGTPSPAPRNPLPHLLPGEQLGRSGNLNLSSLWGLQCGALSWPAPWALLIQLPLVRLVSAFGILLRMLLSQPRPLCPYKCSFFIPYCGSAGACSSARIHLAVFHPTRPAVFS